MSSRKSAGPSLRLISEAAWWEHIGNLRGIYYFQTPAWSRAIETAYADHFSRPAIFTDSDGNDFILPLIEKRKALGAYKALFSLPFCTYGGPIPYTDKQAVWDELSEALLRKKAQQIFLDLGPAERFPELNGFETSPETEPAHILDLSPGFDALWENSFAGRQRTGVRKAVKEGLDVERHFSGKAMNIFADFFADNFAEKGRKRVYTKKFHGALMDTSREKAVSVYLASQDGETIAAIVILSWSDTVFYWASAYKPGCRAGGANNLLLNQAIKDACAEGRRVFNFGRSTGLSGVMKFKASFGTNPVETRSLLHQSAGYRTVKKIRQGLHGAKS